MAKGMANNSPRQVRRRENLRRLIGTDEGAQTQLALEIGTPKSHLSAILAARRGIGDELAHKLERHFNKPAGWMDSDPQSAASLTPEVAEVAVQIDLLEPETKANVLNVCRQLLQAVRPQVPSISFAGGVDWHKT